MPKKITKEEFIRRAIARHGDKYDYSHIDYVNTHVKVAIYCKVHKSIFMQAPTVHMKGSGCPMCNGGMSLNTDMFIEMARKIHGDKYDYSKVDYKKSCLKVEIFCLKHKSYFFQTPNSHLGGRGCPECAKEVRVAKKTLSQEEFLRQAREVHGDKYDYSESVCAGATRLVKIYCKRHEEFFFQLARNHLAGMGCQKCGHEKRASERKMSTEDYIVRAKSIHGDRYCYDKTQYIGIHKKVVIICPEHGEWLARPIHHLEGHGCPYCNGGVKIPTEMFIDRAKKVHGDVYNYSRVRYVNNRTDVEIGCRKHGIFFMQTPMSHLTGSGCPLCGQEVTNKKITWTKEKFIEEAEKVHGVGTYDYSKVIYSGCYEKVLIGCKKHGGWFSQSPTKHLCGQGCPLCSSHGFDESKPAVLYYLRVSFNEEIYYKIGITNKSVQERYVNRDLEKITVLKIWDFAIGKDAQVKEREILRKFKNNIPGVRGVLDSGGDSELFSFDVLSLDHGQQ